MFLKIGIAFAVLTTFWAWFFNTEYFAEYVKPDHMITAVELPNPEEPQKVAPSQEPMFVPSGLNVEPRQEQSHEAFTQKSSENLYEDKESANAPKEIEHEETTESPLEDGDKTQPSLDPSNDTPQIEIISNEETNESSSQEIQEKEEDLQQNDKEEKDAEIERSEEKQIEENREESTKEMNETTNNKEKEREEEENETNETIPNEDDNNKESELEEEKEEEREEKNITEEPPLKPDDNEIEETQEEENNTETPNKSENATVTDDPKNNSKESKTDDTDNSESSETPEKLDVGIFKDVEPQKFYTVFSFFFGKGPKEEEGPKEYIDVPEGLKVEAVTWDSVTISWTPVTSADFYQIMVDDDKIYASEVSPFKIGGLFPSTVHSFHIRTILNDNFGEWSDYLKAKTDVEPDFEYCVWKEMPAELSEDRAYYVDMNKFSLVTKVNGDGWTSVSGSAPIPLESVTPWIINITRLKYSNSAVLIGVAPSDIDVTYEIPYKLGWYYNSLDSTLCSGPPHNCNFTSYCQRSSVNQGKNTIGVLMDTINGNLSFIVNYVNQGVAYERIPLDKPLVPSVVLYRDGDSAEFSPFEIIEKINSFYSGSIALYKKHVEWDSLTVYWDDVYSQYPHQVEIDGTVLPAISGNRQKIERLSPSTTYKIRVRVKNETDVGDWSGYLSVTTKDHPLPGFSWEECPDYVRRKRRYTLDPRNSNIAVCENYDFSRTIIGNTAIPLNSITSWRVRIINSKNNDGKKIWVGIVPQNIDLNSIERIGWYLDCFNSALYSGPPHNYKNWEYGERKEMGNYVHIKSTVDVQMNTVRGELSFSINKKDYEAAYEGIPLDEPLVASAILCFGGDSVELALLDSISTQGYDDNLLDPFGETPRDDSYDDEYH